MWRSLWRSFDRFSLQYFKYIINELRGIKIVDRSNRELVIDILQSIVEIVTYGDKHDPLIFECFMEYQVMAEFVRLLNISRNSRIEGPLLQYLSIMIQNIESEQAIYFCFSNDYINHIIAHQYRFDGLDLAPYYVSFLRAVSSKINRDTLCLLVKVDGDSVISFPLYSEALKFAQHGEKMIQTAVRALSLCIYNVCDDMVFHFVTTRPASNYFLDLVQNLKKQCVHLDTFIHNKEETNLYEKQKRVFSESDKIVDDLYYLKDILGVGNSQLSKVVAENLLKVFVCPQLSSLTVVNANNDSSISPITSLYSVSRLLQVVGGKSLINVIAGVILHPHMRLGREDTSKMNVNGNNHYDENASIPNYVSQVEANVCSALDFLEADKNTGDDFLALVGYNISSDDLVGCINNDVPAETCMIDGDEVAKPFADYGNWKLLTILETFAEVNILSAPSVDLNGILAAVFSDYPPLLLASLFLLLILFESKDLNYLFTKIIRSSVMQNIKIVDLLLKVLANQPPLSVQICLQTGWFLRKLLAVQEMKLSDSFILLNTSFEQSRERLQKQLAGCWFDHIPDTLKNEWKSCKAALEESTHRKDPFFVLELVIHEQNQNDDATSSSSTWQKMVDAVKDFVLHFQLKAFFLKLDLPEVPVLDLECSSTSESGRTHTSDHSSANFGSEVALGSAFPCRIAFSNAGIRDIYVIPVARGKSGKLLLMEKHPFRNQKGVVIAIAPLPGTSPRIDEEHPTWLHLQIREFDPKFDMRRARGHPSKKSSHVADGRWTLGFSSAEACMAARSMILDEISKQRFFVEKQLKPLLQSDDFVN